jgi:hypothetical protein
MIRQIRQSRPGSDSDGGTARRDNRNAGIIPVLMTSELKHALIFFTG